MNNRNLAAARVAAAIGVIKWIVVVVFVVAAHENGLPANYLAPDGYRYGVMFNDGSVSERWNGEDPAGAGAA